MKTLLFICITITVASCNSGKNAGQKIILTNNSSVDLFDKAITVKRDNLTIKDEALYPVIKTEAGDEIPSQREDLDGDGNWDQIFFVINLSAKEKASLNLSWTKEEPQYVKRTNVRFGKRESKDSIVKPQTSEVLYANKVHKALGYQPYQTDGPMWENDKCGFRHYFDGRNANDYYGKKVAYITPDTVGIGPNGEVYDNYHVMADWGRDVLSVGNSVGIGGFGLIVGDSIARLGITNDDTLNNIEKSTFKIVENGPVRSIMTFDYENWKVADRTYQVHEKTKIWPGMYAYKNKVEMSGLKGDETLLVGLVNRDTDEDLVELNVEDKFIVLYTHDKQTYDKTWYLGLALILPKTEYLGYGEAGKETAVATTYYAKMKIKNDTPVSYYAAGCWEISDPQFADSLFFENYIVDLAKQLGAEVSVEVE